jgi:hypothetical protein
VALIALELRPDSVVERASFLDAIAAVGLHAVLLELASVEGPEACVETVAVHLITWPAPPAGVEATSTIEAATARLDRTAQMDSNPSRPQPEPEHHTKHAAS